MPTPSFSIQRGTNISHWLSQSAARGLERRDRFIQADVRRLADWGFDHLRLPVDEEQLWTADRTRENEAWDLLGSALDWCQAAGLRAIVDLHILRSHYFNDVQQPRLFTDPTEAQIFAELWRDLAAFLKPRRENQVAYELMNEPVAADDADWNRVADVVYQAIRRLEPTRTIVLGSNRWNSAAKFATLDIPPNDANLILTFHYYNPMPVTHYTAGWWRIGGKYTGPIHYPGLPIAPADFAKLDTEMQKCLADSNKPYDQGQMLADLAAPLRRRQQTGLPLYCGEFGVYDKTPLPIRLAWYRDIIAVFKQQNIAWANWDYRGGFGLVDGERKDTGIAAALLG